MQRFPIAVPAIVAGAALLIGGLVGSGCGESETHNILTPPTTGTPTGANTGIGGAGDGGNLFGGMGFGGINTGGNTGNAGGDPCGDGNPTCAEECIGPTCDPPGEFPLPTDDPPPDNVTADGVTRDPDGYLVLDSSQTQFDFLWIAADLNYGVGFVSKVRTTPYATAPTYREAARYVSVTCSSDPVRGSTEGHVLGTVPSQPLCADGIHGCCSRDEVTPGVNGGHQPVQLIYNRPSRTAVDINGDVWVANRAHWIGGHTQASVTKIANHVKDCIDRNGNGQIDTSSDVNADGIITTDCNGDNRPDDFATTCSTGVDKEFYGLDDECILFTVNTENGGTGRPIALGPGEGGPTDPSDAWVGMYSTGNWYRIDGKTGAIKDQASLPGTHPYGAAVDQFGILWAPECCNQRVWYFDTQNPTDTGTLTYPGGTHYGIAIDGYTDPNTNELLQQIWFGETGVSGGCRYRPVRDGTFASLGNGDWACAYFNGGVAQGRGIGVDNRTPTSFAWVALDGYTSGNVVAAIGRIPTDITPGTTTTLQVTDTLSTGTEYGMTGAGVAFDGDIWGVMQDQSSLGGPGRAGSVVHFGVDDSGNLVSGPDVVPLDDKPGSPETFCQAFSGVGNCKPHPYTYSDFTGFGLRNFTIPRGFYSWIETGTCPEGDTKFLRVEWDGDTPTDTAITVMARSADDLAGLDAAAWTGVYTSSPADLLIAPGPLDPNPTTHMEVLFELTTTSTVSPKLKSFRIVYECETYVPR
jgi:hypothetical protein